ncbi:MAG: hypothetical protein ACI9KE_003042 [Polyangiales bacterium]
MRDESSPFLDEALRGIGAGIAGALTAFSIYAFRHVGHPNMGEAGPQLAAEITTFTVVVTATLSGIVSLARQRIGRFPAICLTATLVGPPAVAFASARFGQFPIPFVDHFVIIGGLFVTFVFLVKRFAPSARMGRIATSVLVAAIPFALLAALVAPTIQASVQSYADSAQRFDPAELGAMAGCVIGPFCGIWVSLAVWMAEPRVPTSETSPTLTKAA